MELDRRCVARHGVVALESEVAMRAIGNERALERAIESAPSSPGCDDPSRDHGRFGRTHTKRVGDSLEARYGRSQHEPSSVAFRGADKCVIERVAGESACRSRE